MTLKKDASVAVTLAGLVLAMAVYSGQAAKPSASAAAPWPSSGNMELLSIYQVFLGTADSPQTGGRLEQLRQMVRKLAQEGRIRVPIDQFRAAAILCGSNRESDISTAHDLSIQAFDNGITAADRLIKESEDRLLLSMGAPQMHGTQLLWNGASALPKRPGYDGAGIPPSSGQVPQIAPAQD